MNQGLNEERTNGLNERIPLRLIVYSFLCLNIIKLTLINYERFTVYGNLFIFNLLH